VTPKKRKANEAGIHVVGYVEDELARIIENHGHGTISHKDRVFAEALLILLKRTADMTGAAP
jgi:hypothetical protein